MAWPYIAGAVLGTSLLAWFCWARLLPWSRIEPLGRALGWLVGDVLKVRRRHVVHAMRRAGVLAPERTASSMYRQLGCGTLELLWIAARPQQDLAELVEFDSRLDEAVFGKGRGVVIATAHTGSWDLVACAAAARAPLIVVTKRLSIRPLDWLWQRTRAARRIRLVQAGEVVRVTLPALRRGEAVSMIIDQAPERRRGALKLRFLGDMAWTDAAPALIAMRARVPLVAVFARRLPDGTHYAELCGILEPPAVASREWVESASRTLTEWLEDFILRDPSQWLWMHRRWKDAPALPARQTGITSGP